MATDGGGEEQRQPAAAVEPDNLACPRCDSTNTKFCYYNNYNLSQPRYFCKSCRRYWTRGGTLRNVPVGGGSRKNSKRSRSSSYFSSTVNVTQAPQPPLVINTTPFEIQKHAKTEQVLIPTWRNHDELNLNINEGSFSSLLNANNTSVVQDSGSFVGVAGYGLGLGSSGFNDDMGFGFGASMGAGDVHNQVVGQNNGVNNAWQFGGGEVIDGADCFGWPDLAISTPGNGLD